jgi:hypothetical protein
MKFKFLVLAILIAPMAARAPALPHAGASARPEMAAPIPMNPCAGANVCGLVATPGVPEPSTWALMVMGFAGLGAGVRASRRTLRVS